MKMKVLQAAVLEEAQVKQEDVDRALMSR